MRKWHLWPLGLMALPAVLLLSSVLTWRELDEMRRVYLRNRAATIAARLETLAPEHPEDAETLGNEEPALVELRVFAAGDRGAEAATLEPIWSGRELFRTETVVSGGEELFRAYIPFHSAAGLRIARVDLAASAADAIVSHARHNVVVSAAAGAVLVLLSLYLVWAGRRTAQLERRQLELEHLAQLGKMSAVLAHEIRNPLGTIKGFAQLATEKAPPAVTVLLEPILDEIRRLERLVQDLLLYGRPPAPAFRPVEWPAIAAEMERHARELIGARAIRFECAAEAWRFRTDPDLLKQALLNLVRNAVEAAGNVSGATVRLGATSEDGALKISVEDSGPGLPAGARAKLFEPFFTTKSLGTGLGLSIARKLVESLGGRLELRNGSPGGTRADIVLKDAVWKES